MLLSFEGPGGNQARPVVQWCAARASGMGCAPASAVPAWPLRASNHTFLAMPERRLQTSSPSPISIAAPSAVVSSLSSPASMPRRNKFLIAPTPLRAFSDTRHVKRQGKAALPCPTRYLMRRHLRWRHANIWARGRPACSAFPSAWPRGEGYLSAWCREATPEGETALV